jgi:hypothetical protein
MQVHVLVAVDVVDFRALAVAQPDRLRRGDLPARGNTAGQVLLGGLGQVSGVRLAADEDLFLGRDDLGEPGVGGRVADSLGPVLLLGSPVLLLGSPVLLLVLPVW